MNTKKITTIGILVALALILSFVESQIPAFAAIPGMKLGLTNIVVLVALYSLGPGNAMFINIVRIVIVSILFGNGMSLAFSLTGGMLSTVVMILLKKTGKFSVVGVSAAGGLSHNIGQILVAVILMNTTAIAWYLPLLWISGCFSGILIGIIGGIVYKRIDSLI
jgi:heptaprenyl diphosphate synthase